MRTFPIKVAAKLPPALLQSHHRAWSSLPDHFQEFRHEDAASPPSGNSVLLVSAADPDWKDRITGSDPAAVVLTEVEHLTPADTATLQEMASNGTHVQLDQPEIHDAAFKALRERLKEQRAAPVLITAAALTTGQWSRSPEAALRASQLAHITLLLQLLDGERVHIVGFTSSSASFGAALQIGDTAISLGGVFSPNIPGRIDLTVLGDGFLERGTFNREQAPWPSQNHGFWGESGTVTPPSHSTGHRRCWLALHQALVSPRRLQPSPVQEVGNALTLLRRLDHSMN